MGDVLAFPCRGRHRDILAIDVRDPEIEAIKALPEVQTALDNAKKAITTVRREYLEAFAKLRDAEGIPGAVEYAQTMLGQFIKAGICGNE